MDLDFLGTEGMARPSPSPGSMPGNLRASQDTVATTFVSGNLAGDTAS